MRREIIGTYVIKNSDGNINNQRHHNLNTQSMNVCPKQNKPHPSQKIFYTNIYISYNIQNPQFVLQTLHLNLICL